MAGLPNSTYWRLRDAEWQKRYSQWADIAAGQLQAALDEANQRLELTIRRFDDSVRASSRGRKVTYADFTTPLTADELMEHQKEFATFGGDVNDPGPFRGMSWEKYQKWVPIVRSHLEAMDAQIDLWTGCLAASYQRVLNGSFAEIGQMRDAFNWESLDKAVGFHLDFDRISPHQIAALAELGSGLTAGDFSEAVWTNRFNLASALRRTLPQRFLTGTPLPKMVNELRKMTQGSKYAAERILRTEGTAIATRADELMYGKLGLEQYEFLATLDLRVDDVCIAMDGQQFDVKDMTIGTNAPPIHPHCRCSTVPAIEPDEFTEIGERAARDESGKTIMVPDDMTYQEWKDKYYPTNPASAPSESVAVAPVTVVNDLPGFNPSPWTSDELSRDIKQVLTGSPGKNGSGEQGAIWAYTSDTTTRKIQGFLRDGSTYWDYDHSAKLTDEDKKWCSERIREIDLGLAKLTIPHDMVLYRASRATFLNLPGVSELKDVVEHSADLVGTEVKFKQFVSTSHAGLNPAFGDIFFVMRVPKGTNGGYIAPLSAAGDLEKETLLGRGLIGKVASVRQGNFVGDRFSVQVVIDISREQPPLPEV